ncbi:polysaccharide deacetylase familiy protein [Pullulanibacillus camelliae]|uniref:Polysaccharide deacetylase familiy protein n=1 Tax=Pullulanibacillus camelliae TaxID=1707096 RepID=A0A8J2YGC7_9BACL|nr:polysaccharide deacetylase family protein [Pullulanibacillus camelliae]GGE34205.1 polysaccharide deacetylase familiy protein [Pullulanibacillus camelliae]
MVGLYFILCIALIILCLFLLYAILPTVIMRTFAIGLFKQSTVKGKVALTFDDGPDPRYTPELLDVLRTYNVQATFFVVGENAERYPEIIKRMHNEGHAIGIHHYQHRNNWFLTPAGTRQQCVQTAEIIQQITGKTPDYYRPPWGALNLFTFWAARPFKIVIWSAILGDWKLNLGKERLTERLHAHIHDGAVIVLHDANNTPGADDGAAAHTVAALKAFLPEVYKAYDFITIDEIMRLEEARKAQ